MDLSLSGLAALNAPPAASAVPPSFAHASAAPDSARTLSVPPSAAAVDAVRPAIDLDAEENAIVKKLDGLVGNQVRFRVDLDTDRAVLQITDPETGEVINSIPSEEMLAVMERLEEARCHLVDCAG